MECFWHCFSIGGDMFYILKGLYLAWKIRKYEKKIQICTELREKLKKRQSKYKDKYELYLEKDKEHKLKG